MKGNIYKIIQAFPNYHAIIKPAKKENLDRGRARNGMFILVPSYLKNCIQDVSPAYWRVQAAVLTCKSKSLLIINTLLSL